MIENIISISKAVDIATQYIDDVSTGKESMVKSPWKTLDNTMMNGFEHPGIYALAGHSGTGKTAVMCQMAIEMCLRNPGVRVLCLSLEMRVRDISLRMMSYLQEATKKELLFSKVPVDEALARKLKSLPIDVWEKPLSINNMEVLIAKYQAIHKNETIVVFLDHSRLMHGVANEDDLQNMKKLTRTVLGFKQNYGNVMFMLISQLNDSVMEKDRRSASSKHLHYPLYTDLYFGRELFQICDNVLILNNPADLFITSYGPSGYPTEGFIFLHVSKVRDEAKSVVILKNKLQYSKLEELTVKEFNELEKFVSQQSAKKGSNYGFTK